jgi:nitroreductase
MNVTEALEARRTVRAFLPVPVPNEVLEKILKAALHAPSWANTQPWEIYVASGDALERIRRVFVERTREGTAGGPDLAFPKEWPPVCRERTRVLTTGRADTLGVAVDDPGFRQDFLESNRRFFGAPHVAYLCMDSSLSTWSVFDLGMIAQSIMLAAQDHGVDSAIAVNLVYYPDAIRDELGIPDDLLIVIGVGLGYADTSDPSDGFRSARRPFEEVVRFVGR